MAAKIGKKGGMKEVRERLNKLRKRKPSEELMTILDISEKNNDEQKKVAKGPRPNVAEL